MSSITQLKSFLIDVIIRNQDIKKLETTCFCLTLAIFRFHLEKLFVRFVIQLYKRALVLSTHHSRVWLDMAYSTGVKKLIINWNWCICTCGGLVPVLGRNMLFLISLYLDF